ncbi:hypothetical protein [Lentzea albida]|uniref:Secreted protein n=1 Tax=Lentzea albida TaxID=65499 RepID=A0A1H9GSL1_9PSEU|nr:hypothetical protein [Lentzea albida]SEQ53060.1 hypothetical protein SAMN04488000_103257 [Lentzea albida]
MVKSIRNVVSKSASVLLVLAATASGLAALAMPATAATTVVCGNDSADRAVATGRYVVVEVRSDRGRCPTTGNSAAFTLQPITKGQTRLKVCGTRAERFVPSTWFVTGNSSYDRPPCELGTMSLVIEPITRRGSAEVCGNTSADKAVNSGRYFVTRVSLDRGRCAVSGTQVAFTIEPLYASHTRKTNVCGTNGGRWIPNGWVVTRSGRYDVPPCEFGTRQYDIQRL